MLMPRHRFADGLPPRPAPAPWTASRCNRTLRKLTIFVAKLEKWHKAYLAVLEEEETEELDELEVEPEPDWLARDASQRGQQSRRKYTARKTSGPRAPLPKRARQSSSTALTPH